MFVPFLIIALTLSWGITASPLSPTITSCLSDFSPIADGQHQLNVTNVYAEIVSGEQAAQLGLVGGGHDVLRVDLIGVTGAEVVGYNDDTNKLATLFTDTRAATFKVYSSTSWLCNSIFPPNITTPYAADNSSNCPLPAGDFAINLTIPLYSSYALTTLHTQVRIVDTSTEAANLACFNIHVSPYHRKGWYYHLFVWLPVAVAVGIWAVSWGARFLTGWIVGSGVAEYGQKETQALSGMSGNKRDAKMRKWGTMIISGLSGERLSVSGGLLRFVTPGVTDVLFHIQYCTALAMIAVAWPEFAYPIFARGAWADLVWNTTLVQGSNASSKIINAYPTQYTPPSTFASQMNNNQFPLYLDATAQNPVIDLRNSSYGMESFATAVGLRPQDLFGTCLVVFLAISGAIILFSLILWSIHGFAEYLTIGAPPTTRMNKRSSLGSSPQGSLGGKEAYDPRKASSYSDGPSSLPTQSSLTVHKASAPSRFRRIWFRFGFRGEAGAFHAAALEGNLLRLILVFHLPITIFSMYQLTLGARASIVSRVFAALSFVFISVIIPAFIMWRVSRTPTGKLYDATRTLLALGAVYNVYVEKRQMFRLLPLTASLVVGIVIGAGQKSGIAQSVIVIIVELVMLILPGIWYPWGEGASMGAPSTFLSSLRLISVLLVMLLSPTIGMNETVSDWIAYSVLILQAIVFIFFLLMLITKMIEGMIRIVGGVHFDESNHQLDGGIFAAIMDLDCLNPVRGGKAAARKRRKYGSRQLQRNVSAAGSLTTQQMLDRHSQGVPRQPPSEVQTPFLTPFDDRSGYLTSHQPPLGPPPLDRHSSDSKSDERAGGGGDNIMDAWKPTVAPPAGYAPPGGYFPSASSESQIRLSQGQEQEGPSRSFSVVRGGRADFENPYDVLRGAGPSRDIPINVPMAMSMPIPMVAGHRASVPAGPGSPGIRIAQAGPGRRPMSPPPTHNRHQSSQAILDYSPISTSTSTPGPGPVVYPPNSPPTSGIRTNNQGLRPPTIAIPKRRSLNDLKHDPSPDSQYSDDVKGKAKGKDKKKKRNSSGGWFKRDGATVPSPSDESDDEPGPRSSKRQSRKSSDMRRFREPEPFEQVPLSPAQKQEGSRSGGGGGWRKVLGLKKKKSIDEFEEAVKDENKARKAALAAESGAMLVGVEPASTPSPQKGFTVNRKGQQQPNINTLPRIQLEQSTSSPSSYNDFSPIPNRDGNQGQGGITSTSTLSTGTGFKVRRMGQQTPTPVNVFTTTTPSPASVHPSPDPNGNDIFGATQTQRPSGNGSGSGASSPRVNVIAPSIQNTNKIGDGNNNKKKTFKVIRPQQQGSSSSSFVVNRPHQQQPPSSSSSSYTSNINFGSTVTITPPTPIQTQSPSFTQYPHIPQQQQQQEQTGYPPSSFVPLGKTVSSTSISALSSNSAGSASASGYPPERPAKNPRRPSQDIPRS